MVSRSETASERQRGKSPNFFFFCLPAAGAVGHLAEAGRETIPQWPTSHAQLGGGVQSDYWTLTPACLRSCPSPEWPCPCALPGPRIPPASGADLLSLQRGPGAPSMAVLAGGAEARARLSQRLLAGCRLAPCPPPQHFLSYGRLEGGQPLFEEGALCYFAIGQCKRGA